MTRPGAGELGTVLLNQALIDATPALLDAATEHLRFAVTSTPADDSNAPVWQTNLGAALRTRYRRTEEPSDLDEAIDVLRRAVAASEPADPSLAGRLGNLGLALGDRFELAGDQRDLAAAVEALERASATAGADQRVRQAGNLLGALLDRYRSGHDPDDLERAVALGRAIAADGAAPATSADRATAAGNLAAALFERYERHGDPADLDDALTAATSCVEIAAPGVIAVRGYLGTLGTLLHARSVRTGDLADLNASVSALTVAESLRRSARGGRALVLTSLGSSLFDRYRLLGNGADLEAAVDHYRTAVDLTPETSTDLAMRTSNLAAALAEQAERDPTSDALEESLRLHDRAVHLAGSTHPKLATVLANQAGALYIRFGVHGEIADCSAAVTAYRRALGLVGPDHPQRPGHLAHLGQALRTRHNATGHPADLYEAVAMLREAERAAGPTHRDHPFYCSFLGAALHARYTWHGSTVDLDEAIGWHDRAAAGVQVGRVGRARLLSSRAFALRVHAQRTREPPDVDAAIAAGRLPVDTETDPAPLARLLAALGSALDLRSGTVPDVAETIAVRERVCKLVAPDDPNRGPWLSDLANSLRTRAALLRERDDDDDDDLSKAHSMHLTAVDLTPPDDPEYATVLSNLAGSFRDRYVRSGSHPDLLTALDLLRRTTELRTAPMTRRLVAAQHWGRLAADTGQWAAARDGYAAAIALLPTAVWRGADRAGQEQPLRDTRWLAAEAAACALNLGDPAGAVDLLERGRTVLWNQRLEAAADLHELRILAPNLADRLDAARAVLDTDNPDRTAATTDIRVAAAADWDGAMAEIRARPELARLLPVPEPPTIPADLDGTVALLVVSRYRRDAILVDRHGARSHELTALNFDQLADHIGEYFDALATIVDPDATAAERQAAETVLRDLLGWLWDTVAAGVVDQVPRGSRVWWCPTGPLTYLPVHAAGKVPDRVISSYTPTIAALTRAWRASDTAEQRVLGVAVPDAPGLPPLPGARTELARLADVLPAETPLTRLEGPAAGREAVRNALRNHTWAHLACHGEQNLAQPSQAALALADGRLGIAEIATRIGQHADGAYLSACHTALGGVELTDEVLHLAAALQHAGFRRVIATLWPINDARARGVARQIYATLTADGSFRPDRSATAVRDTMLVVRESNPHAPSQWAPFVHIGP